MSFPRYHNYKDSGVQWLGEVPEHWTVGAIKYLGRLNPSKSEVAEDKDRLCSFVPMEKLKTGSIALDENKPISDVIGGYTYFKDGDVLFAKVTPCFENRNMAIANDLTGGIGFGSSEINVLRPENADAGFLFYRIQEHSLMEIWTSEMSGAGGLKRVPTETVTNFLVAAPDQEEQQIIAAFLDHETAKIDALIAEQQRLIELLKEKRQAVISHAVTKGLNPNAPMKDSGVEWLGEVPAHWKVLSLRRVIQNFEQGWSPECFNYPALKGEWGVLKAGAVNNGVYREAENKALPMGLSPRCDIEVRKGDLIMCRASGSKDLIGSVAYVHETQGRVMLSDKLFRLIANKLVEPEFVAIVLGSKPLRRQIEQAINGAEGLANNLSQASVKEFKIALPPASEQCEICKHIDGMNDEIGRLVNRSEEAVSLLSERRSALVSAAVTGKIDVRGWRPSESASPEPVLQAAEEAASYG